MKWCQQRRDAISNILSHCCWLRGPFELSFLNTSEPLQQTCSSQTIYATVESVQNTTLDMKIELRRLFSYTKRLKLVNGSFFGVPPSKCHIEISPLFHQFLLLLLESLSGLKQPLYSESPPLCQPIICMHK